MLSRLGRFFGKLEGVERFKELVPNLENMDKVCAVAEKSQELRTSLFKSIRSAIRRTGFGFEFNLDFDNPACTA